jgi:hypothetical protein
MPLIESKCLTDLYEIRRRITQEIKDLNAEEQTAYFRRNAQAALLGRDINVRTVQTPAWLDDMSEGEVPLG